MNLDTLADIPELSEASRINIAAWLNNPALPKYHDEINQLIAAQDWAALNDAFYSQIEFGTAGIRGRTGLGSARINSWTVGTAAQGLADYINTQPDATTAKQRGIVIGSDTRLTSPQFVKLCSDILTSNGFRVYNFVRPPQVGMFSFAVRLYKAQAGMYISASHNPPTDNGVKIYWADGAQVLPPHDKAVTKAVKQVVNIDQDRPDKNLITEIDDAFDTTYRTRVLAESVYPGRSAKIVYSPFHGTGQYGVLPVLQAAGFTVIPVEEQMKPDGDFPNVAGGVPNPENRESNGLAAQLTLETQADLGVTTDPDADRIGLIVPKGEETVVLSGNETASLIAYFVCQRLQEAKQLPTNGFLVRTLVTTPIIDAIAADFGLKSYQTFVGFKYIGQLINEHEDAGDELFIYAGEESFGSLKGSYARDKDASSPALIAAEMVSWLKDNSRSVWDYFDEMYDRYGYYLNDVISRYYEGADGFAKMTQLMDSLRSNPPAEIGGLAVKKVTDYQSEKLQGHNTNMIVFALSDDDKSSAIIRPSGTEPKVKLYVALHQQDGDRNAAKVLGDKLKRALQNLANERTT